MNERVVLHILVLLCKNVVLQNISNFVNYSILIAKKQSLFHFCGRCLINRGDIDIRGFALFLVILGISVFRPIFFNTAL